MSSTSHESPSTSTSTTTLHYDLYHTDEVAAATSLSSSISDTLEATHGRR